MFILGSINESKYGGTDGSWFHGLLFSLKSTICNFEWQIVAFSCTAYYNDAHFFLIPVYIFGFFWQELW